MKLKFKQEDKNEDIIICADGNNWCVQEWFYSDEKLDENGNPKYSKRTSTERFPATLRQALAIASQASLKNADVEDIKDVVVAIKKLEETIKEVVCK